VCVMAATPWSDELSVTGVARHGRGLSVTGVARHGRGSRAAAADRHAVTARHAWSCTALAPAPAASMGEDHDDTSGIVVQLNNIHRRKTCTTGNTWKI
jgi:hypothetical protein